MTQYVIYNGDTLRVHGFVDEDEMPVIDGWQVALMTTPVPHYPDAPTQTSVLEWQGGALAWVETASLADQQAAMWERIKDKRDAIKRGGVLVDGSWFHSDDPSRIQQLGLVMMGANVPAVQWKTMSGTFVTMTQALANAIFNAVASLDQNAFANAEQHRTAMMASATPANYDYSTGWPQVYADTLTP